MLMELTIAAGAVYVIAKMRSKKKTLISQLTTPQLEYKGLVLQ